MTGPTTHLIEKSANCEQSETSGASSISSESKKSCGMDGHGQWKIAVEKLKANMETLVIKDRH